MAPVVHSTHRVFVTGATGFVGRSIIHALRTEGYTVRCLVRRGSERDLHGFGAIERVEGDVMAPDSLAPAISGCDTAIHLVGIIREYPSRRVTFDRVHVDGTVNVLAAAAGAGVRRFLHMSALGTRPGARSRYHQTKWAAEEAVRDSALPWTIFRPSIIYGRGDEFVSMLAGMVRRLPVVPVIGDGTHRVQPIPVEQVADGFVRAIDAPAAIKQTFEVGGPDAVSIVQLLDEIGAALGRRRVLKAHVPLGLMRVMSRLFHRVPSFPITPDQLLMLEENSTCDPTAFFTTLGLTPIPLAAGLRRTLG
ncbi:MAG: complex I NDUFA9 subunit family protein [Candidatus Rokubacteria bacterium]|nr:complex I NDUFA9 subunit family protein [Candidatus Rokubacteria bacterium]